MALVEKLEVKISLKGMDDFKKDLSNATKEIEKLTKAIKELGDTENELGGVSKKLSTITSQLTKLGNKKVSIQMETETLEKGSTAMNASAVATAALVTNMAKFSESSPVLSIYAKRMIKLKETLKQVKSEYKANLRTQKQIHALMEEDSSFKLNEKGYKALTDAMEEQNEIIKILTKNLKNLEIRNKNMIKGYKEFRGISKGITNFFKGLAVKIAAIVVSISLMINGLQRLSNATVKVASDIQESQNVVEVAFGDSADAVKEWARTLLYSYGLSENTALRAVGQFQQMGRSMGLTSDQAAIMSKSLTELTGDVASFLNLSQDRVQLALTGIYTGETEALKRLNVAMTQHNIEAFMMSKGVNKSFQSLSQAEKVAWRYRYVMESLQMATGDVARTSNSYANIMRRMRGMIEQARKEIGEGLLIVFYRMLPTLEKVIRYVYILALAFRQLMGALGKVPKTSSDVGDNFVGIGDAINDATAANNNFRRSLAGFDELNVIADPPTTGDTGFDDIGAALEGMGGDVDWLAEFNDELAITQEEIDKMAEKLLMVWDIFKIIGATLAAMAIPVVIMKIVDAANWLVKIWVMATTKGYALNTALGFIVKIVGALFTTVGALVALFVAGFIYMWNTSDGFREAMINTFNATVDALKETWEAWKSTFNKMMDLLRPLINLIIDIVKFILEVAGVLAGALVAVIAMIIIVIAKILTGIITIIGDFFTWIGNLFRSMGDWIKDFAARAKSAWDNFGQNMKNLKTLAWGVVESMKNSFANFRSYISETFNRVVQTIKDKISDIKDALRNMFSTYIKKPRFSFTGSLNPIDWPTKGLPRLNISWLARGGMVQAGGLFVAGESGAELLGSHQGRTTVMPLEETNFIAAMENAMVNGMLRAIEDSGTSNRDIIIKVNEIELGRATEKGLNSWSNLQGGLGVSF